MMTKMRYQILYFSLDLHQAFKVLSLSIQKNCDKQFKIDKLNILQIQGVILSGWNFNNKW